MAGAHRGLRLGVVALFIVGLGGLTYLWADRATEGPSFAPRVVAALDKNEAKVVVALAREGDEPLSGTLLFELLDAAGRSVGRSTREIEQKTPRAQYPATFKI